MLSKSICKNTRFKNVMLIVFFVLWICEMSANNAHADEVWQGDWQGILTITPQMKLPLILHIQHQQGKLSGTLDSPEQGALGIPISNISVTEQIINIEIAAIGATYQAQINDGKLQGTFSQAGNELPLVLSRQSAAQASTLAEKNARPQEPQGPFPYIEELVTYPHPSGEFTFAGTLTKPKAKGPFTAAILISGSGPQDRDENILNHKPFKLIADHLTRLGYAVLRFDDRGTAQSGGEFTNTTMQGFATDVQAAFEYLQTRKDIASDKIGLIGHSEGGVTGPLFAASNPQVAYIIMLAGVGVPGKELWATQQRDIGIASGMADGDLIYNLHFKAAEMSINGASADEITDHFMQVPGIQPEMVKPVADMFSSVWGRSLMAYDPAPVLSKLQMPLLALNGTLDMQVASDNNLQNIQKIMKTTHNSDVTILPLPDLNHLFQKAKTGHPAEYGQINETVNPLALKSISDWLKARF